MGPSQILKTLTPAASLAVLLVASPANGVPCGAYVDVGGIKIGSTDLGASSSTCRDGGLGDENNSLSDINGGAFFGSNNWTSLDRADTNEVGDADYWTFSDPSKPSGATSGIFSLTAGLWDMYSKLMVVLKDGGSTTNKDIKWSAYLLPFGSYGTYAWSYDTRKALSHMDLYGVKGGTTKVPEPTSLALLAIALAGTVVALRRQRTRRPD